MGSLGIIHDHMQALLPQTFLGLDAWMTSQLKVDLIHTLRGSLMCLAYFFDVLPVCTTRHWQTSSRLVQVFNVYTVGSISKQISQILFCSYIGMLS